MQAGGARVDRGRRVGSGKKEGLGSIPCRQTRFGENTTPITGGVTSYIYSQYGLEYRESNQVYIVSLSAIHGKL
jgi:hypothetical protein